MKTRETHRDGEPTFNTDEDRYPTFNQAIRRILADAEFGDTKVDRLEVHLHATGEVTYRYWAPRAEEPDGGYLPPA